MSTRVAAWLAWSLCALCLALAVASLILALLNERTLGEIFMAWGPSIGVLATWTVTRAPSTWLFCAPSAMICTTGS
jgi:hypothetical protein